MSHSNSRKQRQPHLLFSEQTGFQYCLTLPKHLSQDQRLPRQIRWSLGREEALARALGEFLNHSLPIDGIASLDSLSTEEILRKLEAAHSAIREALALTDQAWNALPSPIELAKSNLEAGLNRFKNENECGPTLYSEAVGGELIFTLTPSEKLKNALDVEFFRFDWPLGTSDHEAAKDAAIYICAAIEQLEGLLARTEVRELHRGTLPAVAMHDYLLFARPDKGSALPRLHKNLISSMNAFGLHRMLNKLVIPSSNSILHQVENGSYILDIDTAPLEAEFALLKRKKTSVDIPTTSVVLAKLIAETLSARAIAYLKIRLSEGGDEDAYSLAMLDINDLIRRMVGSGWHAAPMKPVPSSTANSANEQGGLDPAVIALMSALSPLLSDNKRRGLERLMLDERAGYIVPPEEKLQTSPTFAQLVHRFEEDNLSQGVWSHTRTRIMVHSRLNAITELVGPNRRVSALKRADFIALRDSIRLFPKNRSRIAAARQQSLQKLISERQYETINARTAKKFFELARSLMRYAHDNGLASEDLGSGLLFSTRGAPPVRRRTYDHSQIEKLLNGPVYRIIDMPRWRLDDYKFWLPLLGIYTGARLGELCQLQVENVYEDDGVWVIRVDGSHGKHVKTPQSERLIPIHRALINAGFIDFVRHREKQAINAQCRLFQSLAVYGTLAPSHTASKWYAGADKARHGFLGECDLIGQNLTFHGLRHTFINQFRRQKLDMQIAKALVGHLDKSTTGGYGDSYPSGVLKEELDKIDFNVDSAHITYSDYQLYQALQSGKKIGRPSRLDNNPPATKLVSYK